MSVISQKTNLVEKNWINNILISTHLGENKIRPTKKLTHLGEKIFAQMGRTFAQMGFRPNGIRPSGLLPV